MKTLTLAQLSEDTFQFMRQFGPGYPTTITEFRANCRSIVADTCDKDDFKERFEQADIDLDEPAKEITDLQSTVREKEREIDRLKDLLSEKEDGKTILEWVAEAMANRESEKQARFIAAEWERECTALRKRKGVQAGMFRRSQDIIAMLEESYAWFALDAHRTHAVMAKDTEPGRRMIASLESLLAAIQSSK